MSYIIWRGDGYYQVMYTTPGNSIKIMGYFVFDLSRYFLALPSLFIYLDFAFVFQKPFQGKFYFWNGEYVEHDFFFVFSLLCVFFSLSPACSFQFLLLFICYKIHFYDINYRTYTSIHSFHPSICLFISLFHKLKTYMHLHTVIHI